MVDHYVYIFRDQRGRPRYVGYGRLAARASSHLSASHNAELTAFLESGVICSLEIAGPFSSEETGRAVETALISALSPDFNRANGPVAWRFRPMGVPAQFAPRLSLPRLKRDEFLSEQGSDPMPVMLVRITDEDFGDGRLGYDPASPPTDSEILVRVDRWWQVEDKLPAWASAPMRSPGLLLGVNGAPGSQVVIAALLIDRNRWKTVDHFPSGGKKVSIPTMGPADLDAFGLRGRRIAKEAGISFEGVPAGFFMILFPDGSTEAGRRPRRPRRK